VTGVMTTSLSWRRPFQVHFIIFLAADASMSDFASEVDKGDLVDFIDAGRNVLATADSSYDDVLELLAQQIGVTLGSRKSAVCQCPWA
jgi:hypothetical protein